MFIKTDNYRLWIEPGFNGYRFDSDDLNLFILKKEIEGYRPVTITLNIGDLEISNVAEVGTNDPPKSVIPYDIAFILLRGLAHYIISTEGDIVATVERLRDELARERTRLDKLISGIGRLGGYKENS